MSLRLPLVFLFAVNLLLPERADAQTLQRVPATGDDFVLVFSLPAEGGQGKVVRTDAKGATIATWSLPCSVNALCVHAKGTVIAPSDGGLALLDAAGKMKVRVPGLVYDSIVCHGDHAYAAGRTLRVHRFELPTLANRTTVFEANLWIARLIMPTAGLLAAASWDGGVWLHDLTAGTRRTLPGKKALIDLGAGPGGTWLTLSDEGQILTLRESGSTLHTFKARGARRLAASSAGVLAVLIGAQDVALYRQSGVRWVSFKRVRLPRPATGDAPLPLGAGRWAILTSDGPFFFVDTP